MNSVALESPPSNTRRWLVLFAVIFLTQLLLIYLLSFRGQTSKRPAISVVPLQLFPKSLTEPQFSEMFLAGDPMLFASANLRGFSGTAWLKEPERVYEQKNALKLDAPFWLPLNLEQLGNDITPFIQTNIIAPVTISESAAPRILLPPIIERSNQLKTQSELRIEGDLASRELIALPQLQTWTHTEILSNSIVQVAVDRSGSVLSPRLLSRSGFANADRNALELARNLRFSPGEKNDVTLGKLIFDWRTVSVAATNSEVKAIQP